MRFWYFDIEITFVLVWNGFSCFSFFMVKFISFVSVLLVMFHFCFHDYLFFAFVIGLVSNNFFLSPCFGSNIFGFLMINLVWFALFGFIEAHFLFLSIGNR